jgi:hypothetical protein
MLAFDETMRNQTNSDGIRRFMRELGSRVKKPLRIYLTGGATCVLHGWRNTTVDIDFKPVPDLGEVYEIIAQLKNELRLNIEIASPDNFLPALPGWEDRSEIIETVGTVGFYHYDPYSQILSKIARGFEQDLVDAKNMLATHSPDKLRELFETIRPQLIRYPAVEEKILSNKLSKFLEAHEKEHP